MNIEIRVETPQDALAPFLLPAVLEAWREAGHTVWVRQAGLAPAQPDRVLIHVDRSVLPEAFAKEPHPCPVLNGRALDIRKRRVSRHLLHAPEPGSGAVVVKTDLNHHGNPERRRAPAASAWRRPLGSLHAWLRRPGERRLFHRRYPVFEDADRVPRWVWRAPEYVVERFLPERDGSFYVLRNWVFLGDRERSVVVWSRDPIVKANNHVKFADDGPPPPALHERRRELGLDYGKIDWVLHQGEPVVLDANKTPAAAPSPRLKAIAAELAEGIASCT